MESRGDMHAFVPLEEFTQVSAEAAAAADESARLQEQLAALEAQAREFYSLVEVLTEDNAQKAATVERQQNELAELSAEKTGMRHNLKSAFSRVTEDAQKSRARQRMFDSMALHCLSMGEEKVQLMEELRVAQSQLDMALASLSFTDVHARDAGRAQQLIREAQQAADLLKIPENESSAKRRALFQEVCDLYHLEGVDDMTAEEFVGDLVRRVEFHADVEPLIPLEEEEISLPQIVVVKEGETVEPAGKPDTIQIRGTLVTLERRRMRSRGHDVEHEGKINVHAQGFRVCLTDYKMHYTKDALVRFKGKHVWISERLPRSEKDNLPEDFFKPFPPIQDVLWGRSSPLCQWNRGLDPDVRYDPGTIGYLNPPPWCCLTLQLIGEQVQHMVLPFPDAVQLGVICGLKMLHGRLALPGDQHEFYVHRGRMRLSEWAGESNDEVRRSVLASFLRAIREAETKEQKRERLLHRVTRLMSVGRKHVLGGR
ncbi:MAG: hypothetical protein KVP17_002678 [Porospora cf. gigantea B]|nr:MAG: hypothetical protein KVP17_002678 [Porospora cf. gigantea B]